MTAFGISTDRAFSHAAFADRYGLNFPLPSDCDGSVSDEYGVFYNEVNGHRQVSKRAVFVVDASRIIRYRWVADRVPQQPDWAAV